MKKQTARKLPKKSKYLNIYREIQEKIRSGEYKPGDRIESVRSISERHGFQRGIGLYAMEMLVADGILYSIPKSGFYVNPELDIRRYYTIGYFLNNASPMKSGVSIGGVQKTALRHGYRVIFGMNYQQDCTVTNFMQEHPDLDGIVLDGVLDERTVQAASRFHLPYMVLGNHDISPKHPQKRIPVAERFRKAFSPALKKFAGKRAGLLYGTRRFSSNLDAVRGIRAAFKENGIISDPDWQIECGSTNDYANCLHLIRDIKPDLICMWGDSSDAYRRTMQLAKDTKRPVVVYGAHPFRMGDADLFDIPVPITLLDETAVCEGVEDLFAEIERRLEEISDL